MARKSSSQLSMGKIGVVLALIALIGGFFIYSGSQKKSTPSGVKNTLPIAEYGKVGSSLRDNEYTLYGVVENRDTSMGGELVTLIVETENGTKERLPIIVPAGAMKMVNIEREQSYYFDVKIESRGSNNGVIVAQKVQQ